MTAPRLWPNSTIACLASGPSLTQADCDVVRGKVDAVIAVNDAVRLAPWADVLYSSDCAWMPTFFRRGGSFAGLRFSIGRGAGSAEPDPRFRRVPDVTVLTHTGLEGLETDPRGLRSGKNSGFAAIGLAYHFGAKRILLLGYNMGALKGKRHFHGDPANSSPYSDFRRYFPTIAEPLTQAGVEVVNCTPETTLTCFPVVDLRAALAAEVAA